MPTNILLTSILAHEQADLLRGYAKTSETMTGKDFSRTSSSNQKPFPYEPFRLNWKQIWSHTPKKKPLATNPKWPGHESEGIKRLVSSFWPFSIFSVCFPWESLSTLSSTWDGQQDQQTGNPSTHKAPSRSVAPTCLIPQLPATALLKGRRRGKQRNQWDDSSYRDWEWRLWATVLSSREKGSYDLSLSVAVSRDLWVEISRSNYTEWKEESGQKKQDIPGAGDGFQQTEDSGYLGEDDVFQGDGCLRISSCYRCEAEGGGGCGLIPEHTSIFRRCSHELTVPRIMPFHIGIEVIYWVYGPRKDQGNGRHTRPRCNMEQNMGVKKVNCWELTTKFVDVAPVAWSAKELSFTSGQQEDPPLKVWLSLKVLEMYTCQY